MLHRAEEYKGHSIVLGKGAKLNKDSHNFLSHQCFPQRTMGMGGKHPLNAPVNIVDKLTHRRLACSARITDNVERGQNIQAPALADWEKSLVGQGGPSSLNRSGFEAVQLGGEVTRTESQSSRPGLAAPGLRNRTSFREFSEKRVILDLKEE